MEKRKLDKDTNFYYDHNEDKVYIEKVADVEPVLNATKRQMNDHEGGYKEEVFNKVGTIHPVVFEAWIRKKGITYEEAMQDSEIFLKFLQDPDNAAFRTHPTFFKRQ